MSTRPTITLQALPSATLTCDRCERPAVFAVMQEAEALRFLCPTCAGSTVREFWTECARHRARLAAAGEATGTDTTSTVTGGP